jgi:pimeloyl-ACP methyl ester carboxylesterase
VSAANGVDYAYREVGAGSVPLVLLQYSYLLAGLIPQAQVKIYPDSAHGFLFQHHAEFAADVEALLRHSRSA